MLASRLIQTWPHMAAKRRTPPRKRVITPRGHAVWGLNYYSLTKNAARVNLLCTNGCLFCSQKRNYKKQGYGKANNNDCKPGNCQKKSGTVQTHSLHDGRADENAARILFKRTRTGGRQCRGKGYNGSATGVSRYCNACRHVNTIKVCGMCMVRDCRQEMQTLHETQRLTEKERGSRCSLLTL